MLRLAIALSICGCGGPLPLMVTTVHPTAPAVEAEGTLDVRGQSVLVVSAPALLSLTAPVAVDTAGYDVVAGAFETALLRAGAQPVSQGALANVLANAELRAQLGSMTGEGALVEMSIVLGRATSAPLVLVIRQVGLSYAPDPIARLASAGSSCREWRVRAAEVGVDAVLVRVEDANVLWTGRTTVRTTDLLPEPATLAAGPGFEQYDRDYGPIRVMATGDTRNVCEGSDIPGYTCWEVETFDCGAGEGQGARPISDFAVQTLVERAVAELVPAPGPSL